ncbi:MAG: MFS transporter [Burkholderiaceae bacterium]
MSEPVQPVIPVHPAPVRALVVTLAVQTLAAMAQQTPVVLAVVLAAMLGIGAEKIGFFTGLVYLMALTSGLILSTRIAQFGAVRFSQLSMVSCAFGLFAVAVGSIHLLIVAALLLGVGYGLANPTAAVILGQHAPVNNRGLYFSLKQTGVPLGIALCGLLVPSLLSLWGLRGAALSVAAICLLCAALLQPTVARFDRPTGVNTSRGNSLLAPLQKILAMPGLRRLGMVSFAYAAAQVCFLTFLVVYLTTERSMSLVIAASTLAAGQAASVVGRPFWGWVADRWGNPALILGCLGPVMGVAFVVLALLPEHAGTYTAYLAAMFCAATAVAWNGVFYAELVNQADASTLAEVTGGVQALTFAGAMTGPIVFSLAVSVTQSYQWVFLALAVLPTVVGVIALLNIRKPAPVIN